MEQDPMEAGRIAFERLSALIEEILTENESWRQTLVMKAGREKGLVHNNV